MCLPLEGSTRKLQKNGGRLKDAQSWNESTAASLVSFFPRVREGQGRQQQSHWGHGRASLGERGGSYARAGRRSQVAASAWQGLSSFSLARSHYLSEGCNAGRKFFKRLNYYCFLCGCLRWSMKKSFKGT